MFTDSVEYAIIGGGISGLYAAFQLTARGVKGENILILEKLSSVGGRLDTDIIQEDDIKEEEGAMRFHYSAENSNMPLLKRLIDDERLMINPEKDICSFPMKPMKGPNKNRLCFHNRSFTQWYAAENPQIWSDMFGLEPNERFKSADDIIRDIYVRLINHNKYKIKVYFSKRGEPKNADIVIEQDDRAKLGAIENADYWAFFRNNFTWTYGMQEIPLQQYSMQALLTAMGYSYACKMMLIQTQGFLFVSLSKGNAGCILQELITFTVIWEEMCSFRKGWSFLVNKVEKVLKKDGVRFSCRRELTAISKSDEILNLKIYDAEVKQFEVVKSRYAILALPRAALESINFDQLHLLGSTSDDGICDANPLYPLIKCVEGIHLTKINLYFPYDWWNEGSKYRLYGPNTTNLPCAFIYPFYTKEQVDPKSKYATPAALTLYCDINNAQFWASLQRLGHKFSSPKQVAHKKLSPASEPVVEEAMKQLKKVFNRTDIPYPTLTSYRSWDNQADYGYAVHVWSLGSDDQKIRKLITKPFEKYNVYVCNEAFSDYQGWVEGSLRSTSAVIESIFKTD